MLKRWKKECLVLAMIIVAGCSSLQRSAQSGYADEAGARVADPGDDGPETKKIAAEMGYAPMQELTADQLAAVNQRRRLRTMESRLDSPREKDQYSKVLPWLKTDEEKIAMLSIPSLEGRQAWINSNEIWKRAQAPNGNTLGLIQAGDIEVGMPMEYVKKAWGDPQGIDVSGNPIYRNERWKYSRYVSTPDGYKQERRFVYFEGGKVVGWETE
jgi:hypothetical protein